MVKVVRAGEGDHFAALGDTTRVLLEEADSGGRYSLVEDTLGPGFSTPLQLHRRHTETFYVIDGEVIFTIGKETVKATAGTTILVPANTPHAAHTDRPSKMLTLFSPAGLEDALEAYAELPPEQQRDPALVQAAMARYDLVDLDQAPVAALLGFYDALLDGDAAALLPLFSGEPQIDTPLQGQVRGEAAFTQFVAEQRAWFAAREARSELLDVTLSPERVVVEFVLFMTQAGETFDLPVAIAAEREGDGVSALRIYHSTWPLTGGHRVRSPLLPLPDTELGEPAVVQAYTAGLHEGNADLVVALFAGDGYAREPSGARYKYTGTEGLREFYGAILDSGGIGLHHCTVTFDGHACAVEYIADAWANESLPPQSGPAVYVLAGRGRLAAARIYDDVQAPFE